MITYEKNDLTTFIEKIDKTVKQMKESYSLYLNNILTIQNISTSMKDNMLESYNEPLLSEKKIQAIVKKKDLRCEKSKTITLLEKLKKITNQLKEIGITIFNEANNIDDIENDFVCQIRKETLHEGVIE